MLLLTTFVRNIFMETNVMIELTFLKKLREKIYNAFPIRRDANMNLLDALSSYGHRAKSVVELSESPYFERQYSSITDGIADGLHSAKWQDIKQEVFEEAHNSSDDRIVMITDCTPSKRPTANCLEDRHVTYSPNPAPGNKPICIGHEYSVVAMLPSDKASQKQHWLLPLSTRRVKSHEKGNEVGMQQIRDCIEQLSLSNKLVISLADSKYATEPCRKIAAQYPNWVHICRLNSTRKIYRSAQSDYSGKGNKKRYGDAMKLNDPATHFDADETVKKMIITRSGRCLEVTIRIWKDQLIRGSKGFKGYQHPMNVAQITATDNKGRSIYKNSLWISISGDRRHEISAEEVYHYYDSRYDIEHYFRFGKDKLLFDSYQTPDVVHEEAWWQLTAVAYCQLYFARKHVALLPKKWERYLPIFKKNDQKDFIATPSQTQRGFYQLLDEIGTPAATCRPRGNPQGRQLGEVQPKRERQPIHFKKKAEKIDTISIISGSEETINLPDPKKIDQLVKSIKTRLKNIGCSMENFQEKLRNAA